MNATTWAVLVRGINFRGAKRLAMGDLANLLGSLGYHDLRTPLGVATPCSAPSVVRKAQYALGDDVALDLGGAATDGERR